MKVFQHHIYEYRKGLRNLILHTISGQHRDKVEYKLNSLGIEYQIYPLSNGNINVFFGARECVDIIKTIGKSTLANYTAEEDFILGSMLGYSCLQQCVRYLRLRSKQCLLKNGNGQSFGDAGEQVDVARLCGISKTLKKECA